MKKYHMDGLGALDNKTMIIGGMVAAIGVIGFLAYRAKKKTEEEEAAAAAAAAAATTTASDEADAVRRNKAAEAYINQSGGGRMQRTVADMYA